MRQFWYRVSEGLAIDQLWSQFEKDARSSYRLYSVGLDNLEAQPSRIRRGRQIATALFWAILEKLTPARRVLLLAALVLLFFPAGSSSYTDHAGHSEIHEFDLHVLGGVLMFVVLLLELADRVVMKRDLEIAKDIQAWLLPGAPLQIPGYQILCDASGEHGRGRLLRCDPAARAGTKRRPHSVCGGGCGGKEYSGGDADGDLPG